MSDDRKHATDHTGLMTETPRTLNNMQMITQVWWLEHHAHCTTCNWSHRSDDWNTMHTVQHATDHTGLTTETPHTLDNMPLITQVWYWNTIHTATCNWSHKSDDWNTMHNVLRAIEHTGLMTETPHTLYYMQLITQVWWLKHLTYCTTYNWSQRSDDWNTTHTVQHTTDPKDLMTETPHTLYNIQLITKIWWLKHHTHCTTYNWSQRSDDWTTMRTVQHAANHTGLITEIIHHTHCTTFRWSHRYDNWNTTYTGQHSADHAGLMSETTHHTRCTKFSWSHRSDDWNTMHTYNHEKKKPFTELYSSTYRHLHMLPSKHARMRAYTAST